MKDDVTTIGQLESHLWEATNDHNLNIPRCVEPKVEQEMLSVEEAMDRLKKSATAAFAGEEKLIALFKREGLLS